MADRPENPEGQARDLAERVVVVTGGGQGIGREFALGFARAGASVAIADLNADRAAQVAAELQAAGGHAFACAMDVGDANSVRAGFDLIRTKLGRIDGLVNNAAIFSTLKMRPFDEIPLEEWEQVLRVNLTGVFLCCQSAAKIMKPQGYGRIINMSSAAVKLGRPNYLHYIASKSALIGMTSSLARELGGYGVTVNAICPGAIFTEIPRETVTAAQKAQIVSSQCVPRPGAPTDLVSTACYLLSPASSFVTGQTITVDGGAIHAG